MTTAKPEENDVGPRSFSVWIDRVADGEFNQEISAELHKLNNAVQDVSLYTNANAEGVLTIKIKVKCDPRGVVSNSLDASTKTPKRKRAAAQAWMTKGGNQQFSPPRQVEMPFRDVSRRRISDETENESEGTNDR